MTDSPIRPFDVTHRGVLAIAVPMTFAYLSTPLVGVVNLGAVGRLGDPALVGGVAIGAVLFDAVFAAFNFLRAGTTGFVAQAYGAGDQREVAATFHRALILAVGIGLAVVLAAGPLLAGALALVGGSDAVQAATADYWHVRVLATPFALANYVVLGWLIGVGRAGYGLLLQTVLNGINAVLSVAFVGALDLGVAGVGWASFAAEVATAAFGIVLVARLTDRSARPGRAAIFDGRAFRRMIAVNRDIMIRSLTLTFAYGFFASRSAAAGDVVLAANQILLNLTMVGSFFLDGLAAAAEQLAGRAVGARYRPAFVRTLRLAAGWGLVIGAAMTAVFLLAGGVLVDLMTTSEAVRAATRDLLFLAALLPLAGALAYQMDGIFIGATWSADMRNMMLLSLAVFLAVYAALTPLLGIAGLWIAFLVFNGARGGTLWWRAWKRIPGAFPAER